MACLQTSLPAVSSPDSLGVLTLAPITHKRGDWFSLAMRIFHNGSNGLSALGERDNRATELFESSICIVWFFFIFAHLILSVLFYFLFYFIFCLILLDGIRCYCLVVICLLLYPHLFFRSFKMGLTNLAFSFLFFSFVGLNDFLDLLILRLLYLLYVL